MSGDLTQKSGGEETCLESVSWKLEVSYLIYNKEERYRMLRIKCFKSKEDIVKIPVKHRFCDTQKDDVVLFSDELFHEMLNVRAASGKRSVRGESIEQELKRTEASDMPINTKKKYKEKLEVLKVLMLMKFLSKRGIFLFVVEESLRNKAIAEADLSHMMMLACDMEGIKSLCELENIRESGFVLEDTVNRIMVKGKKEVMSCRDVGVSIIGEGMVLSGCKTYLSNSDGRYFIDIDNLVVNQ